MIGSSNRFAHAGAELTLSTFDYEVSAQATVPVITDEEGTILVSGRLLAEIVRSLPARPVQLVTDGTRATLKCGTATFTLVGSVGSDDTGSPNLTGAPPIPPWLPARPEPAGVRLRRPGRHPPPGYLR